MDPTPASANTSAGLVIRVLGGLEVLVDGVPVDLVGGLRRRLLLCLLAAREAPVGTEHLVAALWGDRSGSANALQAHVSRLRRLLDPTGERGPRWLESCPEGYVLRPDLLDVDSLLGELDRAEGLVGIEPDRAFAELRDTLDRWAEPVTEDLEEWEALRHRLEIRILGAQDTWADLAARLGSPAEVDRTVALAQAAPTREVRWALAMRGLARTGRRAEALELYRVARRLLLEEYGIDPGRDLRDTHTAILAADDLPTDTVERGTTAQLVAPPPAVTSFVGREEELATLDAMVEHSRIVTIAGLGGVGKSRLAVEWVTRSGRTGSTHWVDLREVSPGQVGQRLATSLGLLAESDAAGLDAAVLGLPSLPTVLLLDNAEDVLADVGTVVGALVSRLPHLVVVLTSRAPVGLPGEQVLALVPLAGPGPRALAAARLSPSAPRDLIDEVAARSGGLPLAIELLAAVAETAPAARTGPSGVLSLGTIVERAVDELPPDTERLFLALIDLPDGATPDLADHLAILTGASPQRRARQLRELVAGSLVVTIPVSDAGVTGVRHRVLQPIADLRARWSTPGLAEQNHAAIADWLRTHLPESLAAGPRRQEMARLLPETRTWQRTLQWYAARRPDLLLPLANALHPFLRWSGQPVAGATWVTRALDLVGPQGDPVDRATALVLRTQGQGLAHMAQGLRDLDEAVELQRAAGVTTGPLWGVTHAQRAVALGWAGDLTGFDEAMAVARAAVTVDHAWFGLQCDLALALSHMLRGTPAAGVELARASARRFLELDDPDAAVVAIHYATQLAAVAGFSPPAMEELFQEGEHLGAQAQPHPRALLAGTRAQHALRAGSTDAVPILLDAIRLTEATGNWRTAAVGRRDLGLLHLRSGRIDRARHQLVLAATRLLTLDTGAAALAVAGLAVLAPEPAARATLAAAAWSLATAGGGSTPGEEDRAVLRELLGAPARPVQPRDEAVAAARAIITPAGSSPSGAAARSGLDPAEELDE